MEWCKIQYGKDLNELVKLFKKFDTQKTFKNIDTSLFKAIGSLHSKGDSVLPVIAPNIEIILKKKIAGTLPHDVHTVTIFLEVISEFDLNTNIEEHDRIIDSYSFQIEIKGINGESECYNAWHLDQSIRKPKSNPESLDHPLYHFQPGGNRLEGKPIGNAIFIGSPRLPHPPMDIILGIHFILRNFCSPRDYPFVNHFLNNPVYLAIIKRARERLFVPYFQAFDPNSNNHQDFTFDKVFPLAV